MSPASGTSESPVISTGTEGPAELMRLPLSSVIALTRPTAVPAITVSPFFRVPFWTSIVATAPLPLSSFASITTPFAGFEGLALSSMTSAVNVIISSSLSMPSPRTAETGTHMVSPPHSSGRRSYFVSSCLTLSGSAPGLSILFIATIIDTPAALAWLIASIVCGMIPSSAATTRTAISVMFAPLARIAVKAS